MGDGSGCVDPPAETDVVHICAIWGGILYPRSDAGIAGQAIRLRYLDHHQPAAPTDAGYSLLVVGRGDNDTGDHRAVPGVVTQVCIAIQNVPAVDVVDVPVAGDFARVYPQWACQVGMAGVHAAVNIGDDHIWGAGYNPSGGGCVDLRVKIALGVYPVWGLRESVL